MKQWRVINKNRKDLLKILLENRGLKSKKEISEFLNPKFSNVTINNVAIDRKQLKQGVVRIKKAIKNQEQIIVYGDYDVDGICGAAILWESLNNLGAKVMPYIPHRIDEGYGLSETGIKNLKLKIKNCSLIITVDNGIVAYDAVSFANKQGIDVIITDHHVPGKKLPNAYSVVHTTKLCGAGVAYLFAQEIAKSQKPEARSDDHLELVALATIADLVPLLGVNRTLTKYGLEKLRETKRVGLLELYKEAGIDRKTIDTYQVGHMIAPRLNAMGRIESALDSLRLLCTKSQNRAKELAHKLGSTNKGRQVLTEETVLHAKTTIQQFNNSTMKKLLFVAHETYHQGIIGLVASRLVEEFYRPAIVVAKGEKYSKASARSISGFNIIEFIRTSQDFLVDVGGHPMAAGFTVETEKLTVLKARLEELADKMIDDEHLTRQLRIDCEIELDNITSEFYKKLLMLEPFGMGNPQPTFVTRQVTIEDMRLVGNDGKHLKLRIRNYESRIMMEAIAFGIGERAGEFHIGDKIDIVYTIEEDTWNGNHRLQLKIKDMRLSRKVD